MALNVQAAPKQPSSSKPPQNSPLVPAVEEQSLSFLWYLDHREKSLWGAEQMKRWCWRSAWCTVQEMSLSGGALLPEQGDICTEQKES